MICSLKLKKDVVVLKNVALDLCFWFWNYASSQLLSHFHYGQNSPWSSYCSFFCATSAALFVTSEVSLQQTIFHWYWLIGIFWLFSKLYNTQGAFAILFLICSDLLNVPQKPWYHSHHNRKWLKQPKSYLHWTIPHKRRLFFAVLRCVLYGHPRYFKFKWKYQQCGYCFLTSFHLSISYDYG